MQATEQQEKVCVSVWLLRADKITADGGWAAESGFHCAVLIRAGGRGDGEQEVSPSFHGATEH